MTSESAPRRRHTANQAAVLAILQGGEVFRSAQQLYFDIHRQGSSRIALTSVYRILHTLDSEGLLETQRAEDGEVLYRLRTCAGHRHYLLCRQCGRAIAFNPIALEDSVAQLARMHDYTAVTHRIDLYGICPRCHAASPDTP